MAITRRVRPECVEDFERELSAFAGQTLADRRSLGVHLLYPAPGSTEYGILRSFASEEDKDSFYQSDVYRGWEEKIAPYVEGEPVFRKLDGLEAWFRDPHVKMPPRWKMALLTWVAVWPVSMLVPFVLSPLLGNELPHVLRAGVISAGIVVTLTWLAMPLLVKLAHGWLHPESSP